MKCPTCNGCLDPVWIMPNRYWHCDFCDLWFGGRGTLTKVENPGILVEKQIKQREKKNREKELMHELGFDDNS